MTHLQTHCIFYICLQHHEKTVNVFYKQLYILIVSGCLFRSSYARDMAPVYQRESTKVMDYAIIHKQVSAPKFVIFLTLAAEINSSRHLTVFPKLSYLLLCFPSLVPPVPLQTVNASREWQSLWCQIWISAGWVRMLCWMQYRTCSEVRWDQDNGLNERKLTCTKSLFQTPQDFMFQSAFLWWPPFIHSHYISPAPWSAFCVNDHDLYASHTSEKHKLSRLNCPFTRRPNFSLGW